MAVSSYHTSGISQRGVIKHPLNAPAHRHLTVRRLIPWWIAALQRVQLAVLGAQIVHVRLDRQRPAGGPLDQGRHRVLAPVDVEIILQPGVQRAELALADLGADRRPGPHGAGVDLGAEDIAQRVALKRPADNPAVPVDILQDLSLIHI